MSCPKHPRRQAPWLLLAWSGLWPSKSCGPWLKQLQKLLGVPKNFDTSDLSFAILMRKWWDNFGWFDHLTIYLVFNSHYQWDWPAATLQADASWWWKKCIGDRRDFVFHCNELPSDLINRGLLEYSPCTNDSLIETSRDETRGFIPWISHDHPIFAPIAPHQTS